MDNWPHTRPCAFSTVWYASSSQRGRALVARQAHNLKVAGSIPASATSMDEGTRKRPFEVLNFWSDLLDLPSERFLKTFFAKSVQKKVYENHNVHYGVLRLSVRRSTFLKYKVLSLIDITKAGVAQVVRANAS